MRLLIISEQIAHEQGFSKMPYSPPYDVHLKVGDLNSENFQLSVFDYDVSVVIIQEPSYHSMGYYQNLPKLLRDSHIALENGRTVICMPHSANFRSKRLDEVGMSAYEWIGQLGLELRDNFGGDIKPSGAGRAQAIQKYLKYAPTYHQIVVSPQIPVAGRLVVVSDTDIVVGCEQQVGKAWLVILPPPLLKSETYTWEMSLLVDVARRYYEKAQRSIPVGDTPDWLQEYLVPRAKELGEQIGRLSDEKAEYDRLAYALYGTSDALEESVGLMLQKLGLTVNPQPPSANIDLKAKHPALGLGFAIEVTGTKGTIQKDTKKIVQAWQYFLDRRGTPEESDRLIIIANTQYHLKPSERRDDPFTTNVVKLLTDNGVLLITTPQLYGLWKAVQENSKMAEDAIRDMHSQSGLYRQFHPR